MFYLKIRLFNSAAEPEVYEVTAIQKKPSHLIFKTKGGETIPLISSRLASENFAALSSNYDYLLDLLLDPTSNHVVEYAVKSRALRRKAAQLPSTQTAKDAEERERIEKAPLAAKGSTANAPKSFLTKIDEVYE